MTLSEIRFGRHCFKQSHCVALLIINTRATSTIGPQEFSFVFCFDFYGLIVLSLTDRLAVDVCFLYAPNI